jgi:transcriptional regulator with XRE-family HTH domain
MKDAKNLPNGNQLTAISSCAELGAFLRSTRKAQRLTQKDVAGLGNTGNRVVVDIENGKPTAQIQKAFNLMKLLGVEICVKGKGVRIQDAAGQPPVTAMHASSSIEKKSRSPLADPKWGLAWSNSAISDEALVRNALTKGAFLPILEGVLYHGLDYVKAQWEEISLEGVMSKPKNRAYVEGILKNIAKGIEDAKA